MTPSEKQTMINQLRNFSKKAEEKGKMDPETYKQQVMAGEMNPGIAYKKIEAIYKMRKNPR